MPRARYVVATVDDDGEYGFVQTGLKDDRLSLTAARYYAKLEQDEGYRTVIYRLVPVETKGKK